MESLIKELEAYKKNLSAEEKVNLSDAVLDKLYAVYPFNVPVSSLYFQMLSTASSTLAL